MQILHDVPSAKGVSFACFCGEAIFVVSFHRPRADELYFVDHAKMRHDALGKSVVDRSDSLERRCDLDLRAAHIFDAKLAAQRQAECQQKAE